TTLLSSCTLFSPQAASVILTGPPAYPTKRIAKHASEMAALSTWMQTRGYKPSSFIAHQWQVPDEWEFQWFEKTYRSSTRVYINLAIDSSGELLVTMSCQSAKDQKEMNQIMAGYNALAQRLKHYYNSEIKV
ncbi:MAG TPA: hypothetical protein VF719_13410, partial [Abditibacteriaceae bacterium]